MTSAQRANPTNRLLGSALFGVLALLVSVPIQATTDSLWISRADLKSLPPDHPGWLQVYEWSEDGESVNLGRRNDSSNIALLANTYRAVYCDDQEQKRHLINVINRSTGSERVDFGLSGDGESLAVSRNLPAFLVAARLLNADVARPRITSWLQRLLGRELGSQRRSIRSAHKERANNWGTHAGAARVAAAIFLRDDAELAAAAKVFAQWLGEPSETGNLDSLRYEHDLSWQSQPLTPLGINPLGAQIQGHNVDGVLPEEMRRAGRFAWPPPRTNYAWEALQGALVQAELLSQQGYDAWRWGDQALLRAVRWLYEVGNFPPEGDDVWLTYLIDSAYGTTYAHAYPVADARPGKNLGFTALTHGGARLSQPEAALTQSICSAP